MQSCGRWVVAVVVVWAGVGCGDDRKYCDRALSCEDASVTSSDPTTTPSPEAGGMTTATGNTGDDTSGAGGMGNTSPTNDAGPLRDASTDSGLDASVADGGLLDGSVDAGPDAALDGSFTPVEAGSSTDDEACLDCECLDNFECLDPTPICGPTHVCIQCNDADNFGCSGTKPWCLGDSEIANNRCVECRGHTDCDEDSFPACESDQCVPCSISDGEGCSEDAPLCISVPGAGPQGNRCVQCVSPDDCGSDAPICDDNVCVRCTDQDAGGGFDNGCNAAEAPRCLTGAVPTENSCVECVSPKDCGADTPICEAGHCAPFPVLALASGEGHACALLNTGSVKCWWENASGQLGLGHTNSVYLTGDELSAVPRGTWKDPITIAAGHDHTCALFDDDCVRCWGENADGQLGLGDIDDRGDQADELGGNLPAVDLGRAAVAIAAGKRHTCGLLTSGIVKCWGGNSRGQLGLGDYSARGDQADELGGNLPAVQLGDSRRATSIVAGSGFSCALLDDRSVKCWGDNGFGQLGLGDAYHRGDEPDEMGDNLPVIPLGTDRLAIALTAGASHVCALLDDGSVKCWGGNANGELGLGDMNDRGDEPNEMGDNLPALDLGTGRKATAIQAGHTHTCVLLDDASTKCWGPNYFGELGLGDSEYRGDEPNEMGDNLPALDLGTGRHALALSAGYGFSCGLLDDGAVKCWGKSPTQLGQERRGDEPNEMSDNLPSVPLGP